MVEITFVRHGQAQTGATDEKSYDSLSDLGRRQALWLGEHFAATGRGFDCVLVGGLNRQRATAEAIGGCLGLAVEEDRRLDEMNYFELSASMKATHALDVPTDRAGFLAHMPQVLTAWEQGTIHATESFRSFEDRITAAILSAERRGGRVLMVTSGGVIGMAMRVLLRLEVPIYANVLLQVYNTSIHRYVKAGDALVLDCFNAVPHLERAERSHALTWT